MDRADKVIGFIETLRAPDGASVGEYLRLRPWQKSVIRSVYNTTDSYGVKLIRQAVLSIARKNGKTALVAGLSLAHLCGPETVRNGQLYSIAFDRDQAAVVFKYMTGMIYMDGELEDRINVIESRKKLVDPVSGSEFTALSNETKGKHGKSSSFLVFDELAQFHNKREMYDVMMTSTGAHAEPLVWVISTQAADDHALLSELIDYGKKVEAGIVDDPSFKLFLYEIAEATEDEHKKGYDPVWDEKKWIDANPALGDFRSLEEMANFAEKAKLIPSAESTFRNLYCNQRIDAAQHFLSRRAWAACGEDPDLQVLRDNTVIAGLDLSAKNDLTALVLCTRDENGDIHTVPYFFVPLDGIKDREERDRVPYQQWAKSGHLIAKPGKTIDYGWVAQQIGEIDGDIGIDAILFDRWRINDLMRELDSAGVACWLYKKPDEGKAEPYGHGIKMVSYGQGFKDMTPAVEAVEDVILNEQLRHGNHPVLANCAANCVIDIDPAGGRKFAKNKSTGRIDGIVAMAMALTGCDNINFKSAYEDRGVLTI